MFQSDWLTLYFLFDFNTNWSNYWNGTADAIIPNGRANAISFSIHFFFEIMNFSIETNWYNGTSYANNDYNSTTLLFQADWLTLFLFLIWFFFNLWFKSQLNKIDNRDKLTLILLNIVQRLYRLCGHFPPAPQGFSMANAVFASHFWILSMANAGVAQPTEGF